MSWLNVGNYHRILCCAVITKITIIWSYLAKRRNVARVPNILRYHQSNHHDFQISLMTAILIDGKCFFHDLKTMQIWQYGVAARGCFNKRCLPFYQYRDSHYKDKTDSCPSYLYNGSPRIRKGGLNIETGSWQISVISRWKYTAHYCRTDRRPWGSLIKVLCIIFRFLWSLSLHSLGISPLGSISLFGHNPWALISL